MSNSDHPTNLEGTESARRSSSASRRRDVLRLLGRSAAGAGAASPLLAMATGGSGRPYCHKDWTKTTCVQASISGAGSIMMSAEASGGNLHGGKKCSDYNEKWKVPTACKDVLFKDLFGCSGSDSLGQPMMNGSSVNTNCMFNKKPHQICGNSTYSNTPEAHWVTAYCNASKYHSPALASSTFPYSPAEVKDHYQNVGGKKAAAYAFYVNHMEFGRND